jgi:hypothetical protein
MKTKFKRYDKVIFTTYGKEEVCYFVSKVSPETDISADFLIEMQGGWLDNPYVTDELDGYVPRLSGRYYWVGANEITLVKNKRRMSYHELMKKRAKTS